MSERLYTRLETCELLGISLYSLMRITKSCGIPVVKKGSKRFYTQDFIDKYRKDNK